MWGLLICHYCKGLLESPKILACAHSLCEKCLKELFKQESSVFKCPICGVVIQSPFENAFLSSVLDIVKREMNACYEDNACDACSVTGMRNLRCKDCDMLLCTQCLHAHHDSVTTREDKHARTVNENETDISLHEIGNELESVTTSGGVHEIGEHKRDSPEHATMLDEHEVKTTQRAALFTRDHQIHVLFKCKLHENEDLRFFCNSCAQLVCQECVIAKHILHIFVSASDAAPSSRAQLTTLLNQVTIRILYLSDALRNTKDTEEKLKSRVKEITHAIRGSSHAALNRNPQKGAGTFEQNSEDGKVAKHVTESACEGAKNAIPKLDGKVKMDFLDNRNGSHDSEIEIVLNRLNKVAKRKREVLAQHRRKLEMRLALIENCQKFTTNLVLRGTNEEVLMLENCIMDNVGNLCQNTPEVPIECPDDAFVALTAQGDNSASENARGLGKQSGGALLNGGKVDPNQKVIVGEGCCSSCFATGEGLTETTVGQDCTLTVTVKNQQNKACIEGEDSLIARIKTPHGGYFKADLIEHKLGKHKFRYRTYSAGPHILRITLRGEEILGSPFETLSSGSTDYSRRGRLVTKFGRLGNKEGELCRPQGLAVDRLSRIFVADTGNHRIQAFDESGRFLFAFGRKGTEEGEFNEPWDVTIARTGHVIVADRLNDRLQLFTPDGKFLREMHCEVHRPTTVTTDQYNNIVIVDSDHTRVLVVAMTGERLKSIPWGSSANVWLENVQDVACNQTGETLLISRIPALNSGVTTATKQTHENLVQVFDNNGTFIRKFVTPSYTRIKPNCCRLVTDYDDRVLVTGSGNKVQVFTSVGDHLTNITFTEKECNDIDLSAIALSPCEAVVVADATNGRILVF